MDSANSTLLTSLPECLKVMAPKVRVLKPPVVPTADKPVKRTRKLAPQEASKPTKRARLQAPNVLQKLRSLEVRSMALPTSDEDLAVIEKPRPTANDDTSSSSSEETIEPARKVGRTRVPQVRRRRRLQKYLDAAVDSLHKGTTFLEEQAVTKQVQKTYDKEVELFKVFLRQNHLENTKDIDHCIAMYLNHLFWKGEQPYRGEKFLAGWMHRHPRYGRIGDLKLSRSWRALKGWRRLCPGNSKKPMPLGVWCAVAIELVRMRQVRMALFLLVALSTYARPSELLRCPTSCLIPPSSGVLDEWALLPAPQELAVSTKTGEYDHSVALDSKFLKPWADTLFTALKTQAPDTNLWNFTYGQYLASFKAACRMIHLELSPYQTRHSGPSIDRARQWRLLHEVQKRGNWRSHKSVMRYEKSARLALSYQSLPPAVRHHCDMCEPLVGDVLLGRKPPPLPV